MKRIELRTVSGERTEEMERLWLNEVNLLIKVRNNPELLQVLDFFKFDFHLYIVTENHVYGDL